jgi:hypothetical protein
MFPFDIGRMNSRDLILLKGCFSPLTEMQISFLSFSTSLIGYRSEISVFPIEHNTLVMVSVAETHLVKEQNRYLA